MNTGLKKDGKSCLFCRQRCKVTFLNRSEGSVGKKGGKGGRYAINEPSLKRNPKERGLSKNLLLFTLRCTRCWEKEKRPFSEIFLLGSGEQDSWKKGTIPF